MKLTVNTEKLVLIVEHDGRKYRYSDKIQDETELGYLEGRMEWFEKNDKLSACLTTEFTPL